MQEMQNYIIINLLEEIKDYLSSIDNKLHDINNECKIIKSSVSNISGNGHNNIKDIIDKLDSISRII